MTDHDPEAFQRAFMQQVAETHAALRDIDAALPTLGNSIPNNPAGLKGWMSGNLVPILHTLHSAIGIIMTSMGGQEQTIAQLSQMVVRTNTNEGIVELFHNIGNLLDADIYDTLSEEAQRIVDEMANTMSAKFGLDYEYEVEGGTGEETVEEVDATAASDAEANADSLTDRIDVGTDVGAHNAFAEAMREASQRVPPAEQLDSTLPDAGPGVEIAADDAPPSEPEPPSE